MWPTFFPFGRLAARISAVDDLRPEPGDSEPGQRTDREALDLAHHDAPPRAVNAIARARRIAASRPTTYKLGAGGRNPDAPTPFTVRDGVLGCDCVGFTSWCVGIDRYQPRLFPYYSGWINTDSSIMDARGKRVLFEEVPRPELGGWIVFPSLFRPDGTRSRIGHVGLVVDVPRDMPAADHPIWQRDTRGQIALSARLVAVLGQVKVIDCAAAKSRRLVGRAVQETTAARGGWRKPDTVFLRFKGLL